MNLLAVQVRFGEGLKRYPFGVAKRYKRKARPANAVSGATREVIEFEKVGANADLLNA